MTKIICHHEGCSFWADQYPEPLPYALNASFVEVGVEQVFTSKEEPEVWVRVKMVDAKNRDGDDITNAGLFMPADMARALAKRLVEMADAIDRGDFPFEP
jgi:hypothetical protein